MQRNCRPLLATLLTLYLFPVDMLEDVAPGGIVGFDSDDDDEAVTVDGFTKLVESINVEQSKHLSSGLKNSAMLQSLLE